MAVDLFFGSRRSALEVALRRAFVAAILWRALGLIVVPALLLLVVLFWSFALRLRGRRSDFGFADEDRARLDGEGAGFDVAHHFRTALDVNALGAGDVSVDLAIDHYRLGFDLSFNVSVFSDGESAVG